MFNIFSFLNEPLGWILRQIATLFGGTFAWPGSFAWSVFVFTLLVNLLMIPLSIKTQRSSMGQMRIKPKMEALKKKYPDDQQRYNAELQKLYQEENISMSGGCLPMLIRFPIMIGVYQVVLNPLKYVLNVKPEIIENAKKALESIPKAQLTNYPETDILRFVKEGGNFTFEGIEQVRTAMEKIDFEFFGIDLTLMPAKFNIDIFNKFDPTWWIPILAFATAMISSLISMYIQKKTNPDAPRMGGMMLTMPFISLIIGFTVSCAAGFYWACSSLISGVIQAVIQLCYGPHKMIAADQTKSLLKRYKEEKATKEKVEKNNTVKEK